MARLVVGTTAVDDPDLTAVRSAVAGLDSTQELELIGEAAWLGICGGPDRYFVGYSDESDGSVWQAVGDQTDEEPLQALVGGQDTTLSAAWLVSATSAVDAAVHFAETGRRATGIDWVQM